MTRPNDSAVIGWLLLFLLTGCFGGQDRERLRAHAFLDDKVTQERVEAVLHVSQTNGLAGVRVAVTNGTAYLSGAVVTPDQRQQAALLTERVDRVQRVRNNIRVATEGTDR